MNVSAIPASAPEIASTIHYECSARSGLATVFLAYAADGVIRAVATRFAVRVEPDKVDVTVTEGRVAMQRRMEAGEDAQRLTLTARSGPEGTPPKAVAQAKPEPVIVNAGEAGAIRTEIVA